MAEQGEGPLVILCHGFPECWYSWRHQLPALAKAGLEAIDCQGKSFDPAEHDAVLHEPGDEGTPMVSEVLRTGYRWHGKVLRPAMVKVRG